MNSVAKIGALAVACLVAAVAWADHHEKEGEKKAWFSDQCAVCGALAEDKELMQEVKWETHKIENGMMMVAVVPEEHVSKFRSTHAKMEKQASNAKMEEMCGFCQSMGKLTQAGAKMQMIETSFGSVTLVTADDKSTVEKIHQHAERTKEEAKKMQTASRQ